MSRSQQNLLRLAVELAHFQSHFAFLLYSRSWNFLFSFPVSPFSPLLLNSFPTSSLFFWSTLSLSISFFLYPYCRWMHRPLIITPTHQDQEAAVVVQMAGEAPAALMMVMAVPGTDPRSLVGQDVWATMTPGLKEVRMTSVKEEQTMERMKRSTYPPRRKKRCSVFRNTVRLFFLSSSYLSSMPSFLNLLRHPHFHS